MVAMLLSLPWRGFSIALRLTLAESVLAVDGQSFCLEKLFMPALPIGLEPAHGAAEISDAVVLDGQIEIPAFILRPRREETHTHR